MNINELLKFANNIGPPVRKIDTILHRWNNQQMNTEIEYNIQAHIDHQYNMLYMLDGFEKEVFNDPNVYNGVTGTMTDMLRACYFTLYNNLLQKSIVINIEKDYSILISILLGISYNETEHKLDIPLTEFNAIQQIILKFKSIKPYIYDKIWWETFANKLIEAYKSLESWEWWINNPNEHSFEKIIERIKGFKIPTHGIWEYHPSYIDYSLNSWNVDLESNLKKINCLNILFSSL
jgi:hypothetical protein